MTKSPPVFPNNPRLSFTKTDKGETESCVWDGKGHSLDQLTQVLREEQEDKTRLKTQKLLQPIACKRNDDLAGKCNT